MTPAPLKIQKSAMRVEFLSCDSRGYVFLDVVSDAVILALFKRSFRDLLYFTWLSQAYIDHRVALRTPVVKEAGQQHSADQDNSEKLPSAVESQRWFKDGSLNSPF